MFLAKLVTKITPGQTMRRARAQDPTLRYRIAFNPADLKEIALSDPAVDAAQIEVDDDVGFPLLLETWDGGVSWGGQLPLEAALATDWEAAQDPL